MVLEKEIEAKLKKEVERRGGKCLKFISAVDGVPDRIVILPGGKVIFIELKRPKGGRLSEIQKYWLKVLNKLGCRAEVIKNEEDIKRLFEVLNDER